MNASHTARHTNGRRAQTMSDPRETSAVQASALGYHLTPAGRHASYRTFNPREAVGPTAPGVVRRILHAINGGNPSSHAEPDSWDLISR